MDLYEFVVESNLADLSKVISEWRRGVQSELLPLLATRVRDQARRRVATTKRSPDSRPWKKRKSNRYKHGLLTLSRKLLRSIRTHRLSRNSVETGSALKYAAYQQEGTRRIPAREFLGVGREDREALGREIDGWAARFGGRTRQLARELRAG